MTFSAGGRDRGVGTVVLNCNQEGKFPYTLKCTNLTEIVRGSCVLALSGREGKVTQLLINRYDFIVQVLFKVSPRKRLKY